MSNATTFASFNSNLHLTLIVTHEPDVRTLSMVVAQTRGMFMLIHEHELITAYRVLAYDANEFGWTVSIVDDVGNCARIRSRS